MRSGGGSAVLRRPGVPGITTPPDIGANLDYLAKIFWPGGSNFSTSDLILVMVLVVVQLDLICIISFSKLAICGNNAVGGYFWQTGK